MKAVCWNGVHDVRVERVPDPQLLNPRDAIVEITATAICGSDLHLYDGYIPTMQPGDILGHEFMGRVVELGSEVKNLKVGDRVVVPFTIACGRCYYCERDQRALCDNSNPNAWMAEAMWGHSPAGFYGYSHLVGGYAGGQAQYARVPFADSGPLVVNGNGDGLSDEQVLFLSDIFPTGYMAAENGNIQPGDVVAVWGCGPVGLFTIKSAYLLGAERVIAIDHVPERLELAEREGKAEVIDFSQWDVVEVLREMTGGRGPDVCIDAVGMEAHGASSLDAIYDKVKQSVRLETGRPHVLRETIQACRKGGTVSLAGVYGGFVDKIPIGAAFNKGLTLRMGQTHVQKYMRPLLERIQQGEIDPTFVITHRLPLDAAPEAYRMFRDKEDNCIKVVLRP
ncbi:MAG: glutathione-dependent formaldehyde dehydrogenase [Anaerolineaceae bacterium]|nr:glutathione-dependent formaldehyde dehydrogenase [Anaerolineaceae bacterium]